MTNYSAFSAAAMQQQVNAAYLRVLNQGMATGQHVVAPSAIAAEAHQGLVLDGVAKRVSK